MSTEWTEAMIATLTRMWNAGEPASAIAKQLGVSKNAIVGKKGRLGLTDRPNPVKRDVAPVVAKPTKAEQPQARRDALRAVVTAPERVEPPIVETIFRSRKLGGCQWPMWAHHESANHVYCDAPSCGDGIAYCAAHHAMAITRVSFRVAA